MQKYTDIRDLDRSRPFEMHLKDGQKYTVSIPHDEYIIEETVLLQYLDSLDYYCIVPVQPDDGEVWFEQEPLEPVAAAFKCTCGAKFTSNPNLHSDWCDSQGE